MQKNCSCFLKPNGARLNLIKLLVGRCRSSTATQVEPVEVTASSAHPGYMMCEKDPVSQTMEDYNKIYTLNNQAVETKLSEAIPKGFRNISKAIREHSMLIRKPALNILDELKNSSTLKKYILHGPSGGGKSLCLLHIMHYCLLNDWLLLYVPNGYRFVDSQGKTGVQPSQWKEGRVDQPTESLIWLNTFRAMNENFLLQNKTSKEYKWGKRESTEQNKPLMDILEQGVGRSLYANDAVGVLLKEIRMNKNINVLYAVDAFNGLFDRTSHKLNETPVNTQDLSLVHHFTKFLKPEYSLASGACVCALSESVQYLSNKQDLFKSQFMTDNLKEFDFIKVGNYTENEYINVMRFYEDKGWIARDILPLKEVRFMSGRNPNTIAKYCSRL